jgi:acyl carrier protein phosphodiesterase
VNFLAHLFLSGDNSQLMVGNFIADFVKGKKKDDYPLEIKKGIELHRAIDDFTDHHEITSVSKKRLYKNHHHYSAVVIDLFYDHFLAKNFSEYSEIPLKVYADDVYKILQKNESFFPTAVKAFFPYMIERNWLVNYSTVEGIGRTLTGLGKRVHFENRMDRATVDLAENYSDYENEFSSFFPELINFVAKRL